MTRRKRIIDELKLFLEQILISNGYVTDAGNSVFLDKSEISDSTIFPAININESADTIRTGEDTIWPSLNLPINIEGFAECTPDTANLRAHELIGDIKQAVFSNTFTQCSQADYVSTEIAQRENGSGLVAVNISINIIYSENLNNPAS